MSRINFIQPVSLAHKQELRLWYSISFWSSIALAVPLGIISATQWYLYRSLCAQAKELAHELNQTESNRTAQQQHAQEQHQLQGHLATINRYKTNPKNPLGILKIFRSATHEMTIESISIDCHHFELYATCPSITNVSRCMQRLTKEPSLAHITLESLHMQDNKVQVTIKGTIITKLRTIKTEK